MDVLPCLYIAERGRDCSGVQTVLPDQEAWNMSAKIETGSAMPDGPHKYGITCSSLGARVLLFMHMWIDYGILDTTRRPPPVTRRLA